MSFAILSEEDKVSRRDEIAEFIKKYGRGDKGLSGNQKKMRVEKVLGLEVEKLKGFGKNKSKGVELFRKDKRLIPASNAVGLHDSIPDDVKTKFKDFPDNPFENIKSGKDKVLNIEVLNDGSLMMKGIILNGKEDTPKERTMWNLRIFSDVVLARNTKDNFHKGQLKEVSDRVMIILDDEDELEPMLESEIVDTDKDKIIQY